MAKICCILSKMTPKDEKVLTPTQGLESKNVDALALTATLASENVAMSEKNTKVGAIGKGMLLGRYLILEELGQGGMGIVYLAFDPDLDRKVALKVLRKSKDAAARTRLLREARAMAKLSHPNVVTVFEVATDKGQDFVSMEYVDGQTLYDWSQEKHKVHDILKVYKDAGQGVLAAHGVGLVHRDFKPKNVLIGKDGRVLVTDFGLAQQVASMSTKNEGGIGGSGLDSKGTQERVSLTLTGAIMGTPAYMAPEQHLAKATDARSDQFSFCVALFEALSGTRPFQGANYAELRGNVLEKEPPLLPIEVVVPGRVREALRKGMSRKKEHRFGSMDLLLAELEQAPGRRWPIALLLLGLLGLVYLLFFPLRTESADTCKLDYTQLAGVWDENVQKSTQNAFLATGRPTAPEVFEKFEKVATSYSEKIVLMRADICESRKGPNAQARELTLRRLNCLERRRQGLHSFTDALQEIDATFIDKVLEASFRLAMVSDCGDLAMLERGVEGPREAIREEVESLQKTLEEARTLAEAGWEVQAREKAELVKKRSIEIGYKPLVAEAYFEVGDLYRRGARVSESEEMLTEAVLLSEECGYQEYKARALVGLVRVLVTGSSRFEDAEQYARRAETAIAEWGNDVRLTIELQIANGRSLMQQGKEKEALERLEENLEKLGKAGFLYPTHLAKIEQELAKLKLVFGDYENSLLLAQRSHARLFTELGGMNPKTVVYQQLISTALRMLGRYDEAKNIDVQLRRYWYSPSGESFLRENSDWQDDTRSIKGKVVTQEGNPVENAMVVCAKTILADSRYIGASWNASLDVISKYQSVQSGKDGFFVCPESSREDILLVAEHADFGRSNHVKIAKGARREGVVLTLQAIGSATIAFHRKDDSKFTSVVLFPDDLGMRGDTVGIVSPLGKNNKAHIERLAPGHYKVLVGTDQFTYRGANSVTAKITIETGKTSILQVENRTGTAGLRIVVHGKGGVPMPSAQVIIVEGHRASSSVFEFNNYFSSSKKSSFIESNFIEGNTELQVDGLLAGLYSVCVIAIGGDYRNPEHMKEMMPTLGELKVYCEDVRLTKEEVKSVERYVPAWKPGKTKIVKDALENQE